MTRQQIAWAEQHDWWLRSRLPAPGHFEGGSVVVRGECDEPDEVEFSSFRELREWAGY